MSDYPVLGDCAHGRPIDDLNCPDCDAEPDSWAEAEPPIYAEVARIFVDIAALLAGGLPQQPPPVLLHREDGRHLFYAGKVNVLFGDPECGKTWIALAACVEALQAGRRVAFLDLDHNGAVEIVARLLGLGATPEQVSDPNRFRLCEPEDSDELMLAVGLLRAWRPAVVVVDSIGELLPMLGYNSNSPDDFTAANRRVMGALATAGAAVIAIDHMPKSDDARAHGQTGTAAKRRSTNGASYLVTLVEPFAPGRGGAASMTLHKDRPGQVRAHCPVDGGKKQPAGRFVMTSDASGVVTWKVTTPKLAGPASTDRLMADVAEVDGLVPGPRSKRDVQDRLGWGSDRAQAALTKWRDLRKPEAGDRHEAA